MVTIDLAASIRVSGGPALPLTTAIDPDSYTAARLELEPAGAPADADVAELALLPEASDVVLLGIRVRHEDGSSASVEVVPRNGATDGDTLTVDGALLIANAGVLLALVAGGPRTLEVRNTGTEPVAVDVIAALDQA